MRLLAALVIWIVSLSAVAAAACKHPSESDAVAATTLVQSRLNVSDFSADMCQVQNYIVLQWHAGDGYSAGQALTKKNGSSWSIVRMTTGSLKSVTLLESLGVPAATAAALANDIVP
ncbi:MAG TPA: hypothetical protein VKE42_11310 [Candidatus Cybelea sp.]|nr:hypothetical protein [Candidatus Cybelea sp.]